MMTRRAIPFSTKVSGTVRWPDGRPAQDVVVLLEGGAKVVPMRDAVIDQRGKTFLPHVLVVTRGTTVRFPNNDTLLHNVYAEFEAKRFDLGLYPRGTSARQTFDKPGIVAIRCNIHSRMSAYVVVAETPWFAVTDARGAFRVDDVVPGGLRVRLWHESGTTLERNLEIGERGERLDLTLPRR